MNTYGSTKSLDSQILGKKIQEQSVAVSQNVPQKSPRLLDQNPDQIQQKKKVIQGNQGKSKSQISTAKKPFHGDEKKIQVDKSKHQKKQIMAVSKTISPGKKTISKKQCSVHVEGKQIKEKQNLLQIHKKEAQKEPQFEQKQVQQYMHLKKAQSTINLQIQKLQELLEQKRKLENLVQLDKTIKNGFYQQKSVEIMKKKSKKKKSKKRILKDEHKSQSTKNIRIGFSNPSKSQTNWNQLKQEKPKNEKQVDKKNPLESIFKQKELKTLKMFPPTKNLLKKIAKSIQHNGSLRLDELTEQDLLLIQFNQLNLAAIQIQSAWKGFRCRKELSKNIQKKQNYDEFDFQTYLSSKLNNNEQQDIKIQKLQYQNNHNIKAKKQISQALQKMKIVFKKCESKNSQLSPRKESSEKKDVQENLIVDDQQSYEITPVKKCKPQHQIDDQNLIATNKQDLEIINEIQSELDHWDINLDSLLQKSQKDNTVNNLKQQMKNTIVNIVQQQIQKFKENKSHKKHDTENSQENNLRLSQELIVEKNFNEIRKKFKTVQEQSEEKQLQQSKEAFLDIEILQKQDKSFRESSLLAIQSQLMKKESELLTMRQEAIQLRYNAEIKKCQNEPDKKKELDVWLDKELEDLQLTRQAIEISIKREANAMKKIQRDLLIAQSFDENNSKLQNLKSKVDEQLSNLKQSRQNSLDIKLVNNFAINQENEIEKLAETHSEDFEQEDIEQRGILKENVIESYEEMEQRAKINLVTGDILGDLIDELADEILVERNQYDLLIQALIRSSIPPFIPTGIIDIRYYIHNFFEFILQLHLNKILKNLNTPYGFCSRNKLQFIHGYEEHENKIEFVTFTLTEEFFFQFEKYRLSQLDTEYDDSTSEVMKELEHIHNKAIFDACNEALNQARPYYYTNGVPYPWEQRNPSHFIHEENLSETLRNMELKVVQWANYLCGFHPVEEDIPVSKERQVILDEKNQQLMMQQMQQFENPDLYDPQLIPYYDPILQIQEKQLYLMLIQDIKENEFRWHQTSDDRTELLMEVGDRVFEQLIEEFIDEQKLQQ